MDELENRLNYLFKIADKYEELNKISNNEFNHRLEKLLIQINTLLDLQMGTTNEWDKIYSKDLKEYESRRDI